jgi:hypothetical protein
MIKQTIAHLLLHRGITIKSLNNYLPNRFAELFPKNMYDPKYDKYGGSVTNEYDLIFEIESFGLKKIKDIDNIIQDDLVEMIKHYELKLNYLSLMRLIMITGDFNNYFKGLNTFFVQWDLHSLHSWDKILSHYSITPEIIDKKIEEQEVAEKLLKPNY